MYLSTTCPQSLNKGNEQRRNVNTRLQYTFKNIAVIQLAIVIITVITLSIA